ncbi:hypothetical protein [Nocardia sp. CC227C]|uniref:hypothetical protein n=1 Tax=Nocardia sp. CC227C TaxID=3044562 RepID=UPI00278BBCBA|nr:hypothetical protein [Nocardia sp. CC227C]
MGLDSANNLVEAVERLRVAGPRDRPVRHQGLTLLWAIGRARQGLPRLVRWSEARDEIAYLMQEFGRPESSITPEYPFVALAHTELWELAGLTVEVPKAHGSVSGWLNRHDPSGGLTADAYRALSDDAAVASRVVRALLSRFFDEGDETALLAAVGLEALPIDRVSAGGSSPKTAQRPPNWTWSELVLACELTADNDWHELDVGHDAVRALSELLQRLPIHPRSVRGANFRTPSSVRRKMTNLAHCHPDSGRQNSHYGTLDQEVVAAFLERPDELRAFADRIRRSIGPSDVAHQSSATAEPSADAGRWAQFKPKSDIAYVAAVKADIQLRGRSHERLVREYGLAVRAMGFIAATNVHPRDLTLRKGSRQWLVEVKVVYQGNATEAVRAVVGQLLQYRYFLHGPTAAVDLLAVFSESIGSAFVDFLESLGIRSVWPEGDSWNGSPAAWADGLCTTGSKALVTQDHGIGGHHDVPAGFSR